MMESNLWPEVKFHNVTNIKVVGIVHNISKGPRSGQLPRAVVVRFHQLRDGLEPFLPFITCSVATPKHICEWSNINGGGIFTRIKIPLTLPWAVDIHKSQGKTLGQVIIDLVNLKSVVE